MIDRKPARVGEREDLALMVAELEFEMLLARLGSPFKQQPVSKEWQTDAQPDAP
jgi:hypothetical protein